MHQLLTSAALNREKLDKFDVIGDFTPRHYGSEFMADETVARDEVSSSETSQYTAELLTCPDATTTFFTPPSYVCYSTPDVSSISSETTYVPGEYRDPSPPVSLSCRKRSSDDLPIPPKRPRLSFSIESILGSARPSVQPLTSYRDAQVTSYSDGMSTDTVSDSFDTAQHMFDIFWCHVCNCKCENEIEARRHSLQHHARGYETMMKRHLLQKHGIVTSHKCVGSKRVYCSLCSRVVTLRFFGRHIKCHNGHACNFCGFDFPSNYKLRRHMSMYHS